MPDKFKNHKVYMDGKKGPFKCSNCEYYVARNSCNQEDIIKLAKQGEFGLSMNKNDLAQVDPNGCSDYFEPQK